MIEGGHPARVFDQEGKIKDGSIELQLKTLDGEVVRVAQRSSRPTVPFT